jgi:hypothetical protein
MDVPSLAPLDNISEGHISDDMQDEAMLFNLDQDDDSAHTRLPQATLESLADIQKVIEQVQSASFIEEEKQWSSNDFDTFLHPPNEQFRIDDPQLRLSLSIYISLSAHSSKATYEAVRRSIKACYPDSTMLSFDQVRRRLKSFSGILPLLSWDQSFKNFDERLNNFAQATYYSYCVEPQIGQHIFFHSVTSL